MGRGDLNDMVLDEPGVSRRHAAIRGDASGYWLSDLDSRNGTFVNGERLGAQQRRLRAFDRIELGGTDSQVYWIFIESQATMSLPSL